MCLCKQVSISVLELKMGAAIAMTKAQAAVITYEITYYALHTHLCVL